MLLCIYPDAFEMLLVLIDTDANGALLLAEDPNVRYSQATRYKDLHINTAKTKEVALTGK